jgi:hypothetical protein
MTIIVDKTASMLLAHKKYGKYYIIINNPCQQSLFGVRITAHDNNPLSPFSKGDYYPPLTTQNSLFDYEHDNSDPSGLVPLVNKFKTAANFS